MHSRSASRMRLVILGLLALVLLLPQFSRQAFATEGSNLVTSSAANDWQIVSGGYQGNGTSAKTTSDDGAVKMQKNVVPTDVENEFLVYVSIDKTASMKELLDQGIRPNTIRLSIGTEHIDDIIADLEKGFAALASV